MRVYRIKLAQSIPVPMGEGASRFTTEVHAVAFSLAGALAVVAAQYPKIEIGAIEALGDGILPVLVQECQ